MWYIWKLEMVKNNAGSLTISDICYDTTSQTIICTSTGGPATSVTWTRDNTPLNVDGTTYQHSQIVTDTVTSTYENRLTGGDTGIYVCIVSNARGNNASEIKISSKMSLSNFQPIMFQCDSLSVPYIQSFLPPLLSTPY